MKRIYLNESCNVIVTQSVTQDSHKMLIDLFQLFPSLQVYFISKATLKVANKQYNTLKHDYEMTLHAHSSIVPCADGQGIPTVLCDFVPIAELENRDKDAVIGKQNKILIVH